MKQTSNPKSQAESNPQTSASAKPSHGTKEDGRGGNGNARTRPWSSGGRTELGFGICDLKIQQPREAGAHLAFTLLEVLIATAIFATVLIAMNTVFFGAIRLQRTTTRIVEEAIPINHALMVMKGDLRSTLAPGGVLAAQISGGRQSGDLGTLTSRMGGKSGGTGNELSTLQIYTTTGVTDDSTVFSVFNSNPLPWSETQKVGYYLRDPVNSTNLYGKELVRSVTRNLLAVTEEFPMEQPLLDGVETVDFYFYDGSMWKDSWDSSVDTNALQAIKVQIEFASVDRDDRLRKPPIEFVVPVVTQARTNQASGGGTSSQSQTNSSNTTGGGNNTPGAGNNTPGGGQPTAPTQPGGARGGQRGGGAR
jgi:prepilin-type N-terminal cleavage/methylation domain-containing protein